MKIYNNLINNIKLTLQSLIRFYINAIKDIDKEYNLILEDIIFSPKYNQKIPVIRLIGSGGYIIETAQSIINHSEYKCHLHPDDLLTIHKLFEEIKNENKLHLIREDLSGEIYFSNGDSINIYKADLNTSDLNKIFSMPQADAAKLLELRGFHKGRKISLEIAELKAQRVSIKRKNFKIVN